MRQLVLTAGTLCAAAALAHWASAQNQVMPGQVVGTTLNANPVGTRFPEAAPKVGQPVNLPPDTPLMRRYDPNKPLDVFKGTTLSPSQLVAPAPGIGDQSALARFYDKLKASVGLSTRSVAPPPNVTPGIFRRNRERARERMWRWD